MNGTPHKYMNPYLAGVLLGLVLLATFYITGRGLGASGAIKSAYVAIVEGVAPAHTENGAFYTYYAETTPGPPLKTFLVFLVVGVRSKSVV